MTAPTIRLIVEDSGFRRSFVVTQGLLSIGAGVNAQLKLTGPLIADEHGELDVGPDGALLRVQPGAQLPMIAGKPQRGDVRIPPETPFVLGSATLMLHYERAPELEPPPPPPPPPKLSDAERQAHRRKSAAIVQRTKTRGLGTWIALFVMFASAAGSAYLIFGKQDKRKAQVADRGEARLAQARQHRDHAQWELLEVDLAALPKEFVAEPDVAAEVAALRAELSKGRQLLNAVRVDEEAGTWLKNHVESFAPYYLVDPIDPSAPRAYVRRLNQFLQHWPTHPKAAWVLEERKKYEAQVDVGRAATWAETRFDVRVLTRQPACPEYAEAFAVLAEFAKRASDDERIDLELFADQLKSERLGWALARLEQAKRDQEIGQLSAAFEWLVNIVTYCGDDALAKVAATRMLDFPDLNSRLLGYEQYRPLTWARLLEQPDLATWAAAR